MQPEEAWRGGEKEVHRWSGGGVERRKCSVRIGAAFLPVVLVDVCHHHGDVRAFDREQLDG